MKEILIFVWVYAAMIATSFWESYVEGRNAWGKGKFGWKINLGKYNYTGYHFYLFCVMWPLLLSLPLLIHGWDTRLFGILLSAYISGLALEDFMWFVVNPKVKFSEWNPEFASHYPWIKVFGFNFPLPYLLAIIFSLLVLYIFVI